MIRLLLLLVLLFAQPVCAKELIPGSYRIEYGGLYKLAADESSRFIANEWADQEFRLYNEGIISYSQLVHRSMNMAAHVNDWRNGPPWWTRNWWDSFETHKGGAPPNGSILVQVGSQFKIIDTPLFSLSNSMDFKWKSIEASVDFKSNQPINLGIGAVPTPRLGWKLKFSPEISFSPLRVFSNPSEAIRRIGFRIIAVHYVKGPLLTVEVRAWHDFDDNRAFVGVLLTLLKW